MTRLKKLDRDTSVSCQKINNVPRAVIKLFKFTNVSNKLVFVLGRPFQPNVGG